MALGPMAIHLERAGQSDAASRLTVVALGTLFVVVWSTPAALAALGAGAWWLQVDYIYFNPPALFVALAAIVLPIGAVGLVPLHRPAGSAERRARASAALAVAPVVADLLLIGLKGHALPAVVQAGGLMALGFAVVAPRRWAAIERRTEPATVAISNALAAVDRVLRRGFAALARLISRLLLSIIFLLVVVAPWAVQRIVRWDPTWSPTRRGSRWVERRSVPLLVDDVWAVDPSPRPARFRHQAPYLAAVAVLLVAAVSWWGTRPGDDATDIATGDAVGLVDDGPPPPLDTGRWYERYDRSWRTLIGDSRLTQYLGTNLADIDSDYLNVSGGIRKTWEPSFTCADPVTIWMFGGSTMFGVAQRDERTIASELAKAASNDGVDVRVENRGVPGDTGWQQFRRLELAYSSSADRPDMVLFYDGFNDLRSVEWVYMAGFDPTGQLNSLNDSRIFPAVNHLREEVTDEGRRYVATVDNPVKRPIDDDVVIPAAKFQYAVAHRQADEFLAAAGTPFRQFYQPTVVTRTPPVRGDAGTSDAERNRLRQLRADLPEGVVDIAGVLDDDPEPYYLDDVHTIESANPIISGRIWAEIEPIIRPIDAARGRSCS